MRLGSDLGVWAEDSQSQQEQGSGSYYFICPQKMLPEEDTCKFAYSFQGFKVLPQEEGGSPGRDRGQYQSFLSSKGNRDQPSPQRRSSQSGDQEILDSLRVKTTLEKMGFFFLLKPNTKHVGFRDSLLLFRLSLITVLGHSE